jgi:2',3'-cyclic-nucleotide 2'-phosphodiesterase (5'-nucleotidase family)
VDAARAAVARLKGKADVIVALTHLASRAIGRLPRRCRGSISSSAGTSTRTGLIERGPGFTPIVKADANVRTVAIVSIRIPKRGGPAGHHHRCSSRSTAG